MKIALLLMSILAVSLSAAEGGSDLTNRLLATARACSDVDVFLKYYPESIVYIMHSQSRKPTFIAEVLLYHRYAVSYQMPLIVTKSVADTNDIQVVIDDNPAITINEVTSVSSNTDGQVSIQYGQQWNINKKDYDVLQKSSFDLSSLKIILNCKVPVEGADKALDGHSLANDKMTGIHN